MRWILTVALLLGCAKSGEVKKPTGKKQAKQEGKYTVGTPGSGWSKVRPGGADKAWFHKASGATIYFDSNCKERFEDGKLSLLLTQLTLGIARGEPTREEAMMLDGRAALIRVQPGEIDGVPVQVGAVVTKKNSCLYDGLLIAAPSVFESHWSPFSEVIAGFETKGG